MKFLNFISALLLITTSAYANTTTLNCVLEKYPKEVISFKMINLGSPKMDFAFNEDDEENYVFATASKDKTIVRLRDTLNGQGGDLRIGQDRITFFGDSAGIDFAYLTLYKNSNYTRGFVRIEFSFGDDKQYSPLRCQLAQGSR